MLTPLQLLSRYETGEKCLVAAGHTALSRQNLRSKKDERVDPTTVRGLDLFIATVKHDAFLGAWATRQAFKPVTTFLDGSLGTARSERDLAGRGVVGCGALIVTVAGACTGAGVGLVVGVVSGLGGGYCLVQNWDMHIAEVFAHSVGVGIGVPMLLLRDSSAVVALAPKGVLTGLGLAGGGTVGVFRGIAEVWHQRFPRNNATMIEMEPLSTIPAAHRFETRDHYVFDIHELVACIEATQQWQNPMTHKAFKPIDIHRIVHHPTGAGEALRGLADASLGVVISDETIAQLTALGQALVNDVSASRGNPRAARGLATWRAHYDGLTPEQRALFDRAPQVRSNKFANNLSGVASGEVCIHEFGAQVRSVARQLASARRAYTCESALAHYFRT